MIQYGNRIARGLGIVQGSVYLDGDRTPRQVKEVLVADGSGGARQALYRFGVTERPSGIVYAVLDVEEQQYKLTGTVTPAGKTVRVSNVTGADITPELLEGGVVASVVADGEGKFEIAGLQGWAGKLAVWADIEPNFLEGTASNIKCILTDPEGQTSSSGSGAAPGSGSGTCETCGGTGLLREACAACNGAGGQPIHEQCGSCGGSGTAEDGGVCPACDGAGSIEVGMEQCQTCAGTGYFEVTCPNCNGTGSICLAGHTLIALADGGVRRLDELAVGDMVLGGNGQPARVLRLGRGAWNDRHTLYHFADGTTIDETHEHRFYNIDQGFWQKLKYWHIGDRARRQDGGEAALAAVERLRERAEMFGLWVERGSYWANGLLSGDASANQALLADATAEQAADMMASLDERAILQLLGVKEILP